MRQLDFPSRIHIDLIPGQNSSLNALAAYKLIKSPSDILLSHANNFTSQEKSLLADTQVPISTTPDTEAQMGFGWPLAFTPGINYTLGVDCHTNNTSSIISLARSALQMARQEDGSKNAEQGKLSLQLRGSTEEAFNAATIRGARAVLLGDKIGSIKEGKLADLVIFDTLNSLGMSCVAESDALTAVVRHSDVRDIEGVIVDGAWRKQGGKLLPVKVEAMGEALTWDRIRENLLRSQREIIERQKLLNMEKATESMVMMFGIDKSKLIDGE